MKKIYLAAQHLTSKEEMTKYMQEVFSLPDHFGGNADALYDCLSEMAEECRIIVSQDDLKVIAGSGYAFRIFKVLWQVSTENPHLHLLLR